MERISDFRSDTVTKPTPKMRQAMAEAEVGDDVIGYDPTVQKLEALAAADHGQRGRALLPVGDDGQFHRRQSLDAGTPGGHRRGAVAYLQPGIHPYDVHLPGHAPAPAVRPGARWTRPTSSGHIKKPNVHTPRDHPHLRREHP